MSDNHPVGFPEGFERLNIGKTFLVGVVLYPLFFSGGGRDND